MNKIGSRRPLYALVQDELLELIQDWDRSKPIPSETDLSKKMGVSRTTVREAIQNLEKSNILLKKQGIGTFINDNSASVIAALNNLHGIQNIVKSMGKEPSFKKQQIRKAVPEEEVTKALDCPADMELIEVSQVYLSDKLEIIQGISYLSPNIFSDDPDTFIEEVKKGSEEGMSLFDIIDNKMENGVDHAISSLQAVNVSEDVAENLAIKPGAPVLKMKETYYDKAGTPLMYSYDYIDSSRFELLVFRRRHF